MSLPKSLEDLIASRLAELNLSISDESTISYIESLVAEESFEREDRKCAVFSLLELDEDDLNLDQAITNMLDEAQEYQEQENDRRIAQEDEDREVRARAAAESKGKTAKGLTPEEESARKQALLKTYGYLEEEDETARITKSKSGDDKPLTVVYIDPKLQTKKARKKAEAGVDLLMQPNLNSAIVKGAELHRRQEDSAKAAAKREKDKNDLRKQKDDAVKKGEDKKKKAAKLERRA